MVVEPFEATVMEVLADGMVRIAELPDMAIRVESVFDTETEVREAFAPRDDIRTEEQNNESGNDEDISTEEQNESGTEGQEGPQPIGRGAFGNIYDAFKGKVKEAVNFLLRRKEGEAVGALHHNEIGDISLVYGTEGYGLLHIVNKHPEILDDLQGVISGMAVVSQSDNRIILESPTHRAVVSKMLGNDATGNWLLTAYEKKSPVSVSSSDIETEPVGMQNGTAPLQNETSGGEVSENVSDMQAVPLDLSGVAVGDVIHYGAGGYSGSYEVTRIDAEGTVWIRNVKGGEEQAVSEEDSSDFYGSLDDAIDVATGAKVKAESEVGNPLPASGSPLSAEETPSGIPLDGNGEPMYERVDVAVALDDLLNNQGLTAEEAAAYVANRHTDAQARYDELQANPPKMGSSVAEYRQAKAQWQSEVGAAEGSLMFWSSADYVMQQRIAVAETEPITEPISEPIVEEADEPQPIGRGGSRDARPVKRRRASLSAQISRMADKYGEPSDLRNFVLKALLCGGYKFRWSDKGNGTRGLASHLGLRGRAEMAQRLWLLNSGGLSPEAVAERIEAEFGRDEVSTADVLNEILDILRSTPSRQGMYEELRDYYDSLALENDAEARQAAEDRELAEDLAEERGFASVEEMEAYEEVVYAELEEAGMTDAEYEKYSNFVAEQILIEENERRNEAAQSDEQNGDNGVRQGGGEILSEPQVDDDRGDETVAGRPAAADVSDDNADGASQAGQDGEVAEGLTDSQGNAVDAEGRLVLEEITSIDQLTDEDFTRPTRSVRLPALPGNVDNAIGANGKPVIIKKNIFEKNAKAHKDLSPDDSRLILAEALYAPNLYGQTQPVSRPTYWVAIKTADKNKVVVLEVNNNKDNVEVVGWRYAGERQLEELKRQAEREDGQLLILTSNNEAAAGLSTLPSDLSEGEVTQTSADMQASTAKKPINNLSELRAKALERGADPERLDRYERMPLTVLRKQAKNYEETLRKVSPALGTKLQAEYDYVRALIAEQERNKKNNKWGVKVGNTATPFEVVRAMFEEWNSDADVAALMDKVAPIFEKLPVKIMFSDTIGGSSTQGYYKAAKGELRLPGHFVYSEVMSNQQKAQTILHEMIHAVTSYALYVDEMPALQSVIGMSLSPEMRKAVDTLRLIFSRIKTDPAFRGEYGSTDVHEMVAELSNPGFRAKLREKGLWQQVVDAIKRLLGIEVKNALDGAEGALQKMLDNFDRTQWDKLVAVGRKHASMADGLVDRMFIGEQGASELDSSEMVTEEVNITPLLNVVKTLYEKGKEFASKLFQRRYFDVAITPDFMKRLGLRGDKFTVKYGVIARHIGKDGSHDLSEKDWERLPQALQTPFAITKLNDKKDSYRIYTTLRTEKGEYVVVGVDVKNAGRELEVNAISTVFGRRNNANLSANEEVIYKDKNITPNQSSLLERPNLAQYPINQELPADKVSDNFSDTQEGMSDVLARPGDRYDYQRGGKITANNVNTALYVESGDYMSELRGVNGISLRVRQEGGLEIDADKLKAELDRALPILEEYRDTLTSLKSRATISAQSVIDNQIAEIEDTIAWSYRVKDNPDLIKESYRPALLRRPGDSLAAVNERFNEELDGLTEENARGVIFDLGMPSEILTSCGIENKPIRLYGAKVVAKAKKHGYNPSDLRNLPMAINAPIAVFSGSQAGSYAILTEIEISGKNVLVSIMVGKGGHDVDFNIITSAYGKNSDSITRWINEGKLLYADKTKTLDYLSVPAPIAGAQVNQELDDAAKIVENFENPTIGQENNAEIGGNVQTFADVAVAAGEKLGVKVVVDPTMGSKGSYNLSTGEVRVNPNAHLTEADVERTVVHEVIGHGGMQALLGERFDEICANVYAHMSEEQRADIRRRHGKGLSNAEVGAEYMAETAERMASGEQVTNKLRQLWERVKGWIRDAVRRRGIAVAMSDADIRYMIATASRKAREGKLQEMIDHAVETRRLRRAAMSQDVMESQLSQPLMRPGDSEDASQLASGVAGLTDAEYVQQMQLEEVARRVAGRWGRQNKKNRRVRLRTNMIDASHPIHKVLQQMYGLEKLDDVEKTLGYGERNAYMMRERAASRAADRVLVFRRQVLAPLNSMRTDFVKALAEEFGIKLSEALALSKVYFAAKTGLERQRVKEETAEDGAEDRDYAGLGGSMIWLGALLRHWNGAELPPIDWVAEAERRGYKDTKTKGWEKGTSAVAKLTENRAAVEEILTAHGYPTLEEWVDYVDGLSIEASAAKGDIGMSRFGTADMWSIIQGVSRTMLEGQVKAGLLSAEGYQRLAFGDTFANILESRGVKLSSAQKRELNGYTDSRQLVENGYMTEEVASKKTA